MKILFGKKLIFLLYIEIHLKNGSFQIMIKDLFVDKNYFFKARTTIGQVSRSFDFKIMCKKLNHP